MSKAKRAVPDVSPRNAPFQPSAHQQARLQRAAKARKLSREGVRGVKARDLD